MKIKDFAIKFKKSAECVASFAKKRNISWPRGGDLSPENEKILSDALEKLTAAQAAGKAPGRKPGQKKMDLSPKDTNDAMVKINALTRQLIREMENVKIEEIVISDGKAIFSKTELKVWEVTL